MVLSYEALLGNNFLAFLYISVLWLDIQKAMSHKVIFRTKSSCSRAKYEPNASLPDHNVGSEQLSKKTLRANKDASEVVDW